MNYKLALFSFLIMLCVGLPSFSKDVATDKPSYCIYNNYIHLNGQNNFRDLGGYVGANGKRIVYRKLFRSGDISKLNNADLDTITSLHIDQVIDLRTKAEIASAPDKLPAGVESYNFPLIADVSGGAGSSFMEAIISGKITANRYMLSIYGTIDSLKIANWKHLFLLLQAGKTSLWHCSAGKDRTGMTTVLVLSSLGVDSVTIAHDFMASNQYLNKSIESMVATINAANGTGVGDKLRPLFGVDESYIAAFYKAINDKYGNMDNFLTQLGVDKAKMQNYYLEK